jgi:hypothetical protein
MEKPVLTRSATLHLRLGSFGVVFTTLALSFEPMSAFVLTLVATMILAKL